MITSVTPLAMKSKRPEFRLQQFRNKGNRMNVDKFSLMGQKLTAHSGIMELMDDLGRALTIEPHMRMLAGGNPAAVPEMQRMIRQRMDEMLQQGDVFDRMLSNYDPPRGNPRFIQALADLLRKQYGWDIGPENIAITNGAQSASFVLLNLLGGRFEGGKCRRVLFPQTPEYIGYCDQILEAGTFIASRPEIEWPFGREKRIFKYRVDFDSVEQIIEREDVGALTFSRPTNPTGNVLTDDEVQRLSKLTADRDIPLIIDSAYGCPFPNVMFAEAEPHWAPHVILMMSLSKLGLPGTRTGIIVAPEPIAAGISSCTAIIGLANGNLGQQLTLPWIEDGSILKFGPEILRPFYEAKSHLASQWTSEFFNGAGIDWAMHVSEGAFFHWLWFPGLRITSKELYQRLKKRNVLTVPGEYFFYGLEEDWPHRHECLRVNYSGDPEAVREGLKIIAEEVAIIQS